MCCLLLLDIMQLITFDEVNTRFDQTMENDIHRGIRGEYPVPWVDQSLYHRNGKSLTVLSYDIKSNLN